MMCGGPGNPTATNNSGGGVGLQTSQPLTGTSQMLPGNQYTPYQQPNWIGSGLAAGNAPIQNYPVQNYGRWNSSNGQTNGYGMSQSPWPSASSITQPGGPPRPPAMAGGGYGYGQGMPPGMSQPQVMPPQGMGQPISDNFGGNFGGQPGPGATIPGQHMGSRFMTPGAGGHGPEVQAAAAQFGQMNPGQQQMYLQNNPRMQAAMVNRGLLQNSTINDLLGGSTNQTMSGRMLR